MGEELQDPKHYLIMEEFLPGVSLADILATAKTDSGKSMGRIEDTRYEYALPAFSRSGELSEDSEAEESSP